MHICTCMGGQGQGLGGTCEKFELKGDGMRCRLRSVSWQRVGTSGNESVGATRPDYTNTDADTDTASILPYTTITQAHAELACTSTATPRDAATHRRGGTARRDRNDGSGRGDRWDRVRLVEVLCHSSSYPIGVFCVWGSQMNDAAVVTTKEKNVKMTVAVSEKGLYSG
jgi:hypothetical protein